MDTSKEIIDLENFDRKRIFEAFMTYTNPRYTVVVDVDLTPLYKFCKKHGHINAHVVYVVTKACNNVENFKFRICDEKVVKYKFIHAAVLFTNKEHQIRQGIININQSIGDFIKDYEKLKAEVAEKGYVTQNFDGDGVADTSCVKWFQFTGVQETMKSKFDGTTCFMWDKIEYRKRKATMHLAITTHHGFIDGYHIALFLSELNKQICDYKNRQLQ